jgi:CheY-like chemotaxis protein
MKRHLESKEFETSSVSNGREAIELLTKSKKLPDIILLELNLPILNGHEFLNFRNSVLNIKEILVLIISSNTHSFFEYNSYPQINKPIDLEKLVSMIKSLIKS